MPQKRKSAKKRTSRKRKMTMPRQNPSSGVMTTFQWVELPDQNIPANTTSNVQWNAQDYQFGLDNIESQNFNSLVRLYRKYRILAVALEFKPVQRVGNTGPVGTPIPGYAAAACTFYSSYTPNGDFLNNPWGNESECLATSNLKKRYFGNTVASTRPVAKVSIKPKLADALLLDSAAVTPTVVNSICRGSPWLSTSGPVARYNGLKTGFAFDQMNPEMRVIVRARYTIQFKELE